MKSAIADATREAWDYRIESFSSGRLTLKDLKMVTLHRGEASRDIELAAIAACGRWARCEDLKTGDFSTFAPPVQDKKP